MASSNNREEEATMASYQQSPPRHNRDCTSLSQSEIQAVLDSVFGSAATATGSGNSFISSLTVPDMATDSDISPEQLAQQYKAYLSDVHLPHLLHSELTVTKASLPGPTLAPYIGCTAKVTSIDESRSSILINVSHPTSPLSISLPLKFLQYLKPVVPKEGDAVRVIRSRGAGTKGRLYLCPNSHQYMIESHLGPLLVSINDIVRLSSCLPPTSPTLTPPLCSRPDTLTVTSTSDVPSLTTPTHSNQGHVYSPIDHSSTYDHTPSPSMSPSSPWGVAYSPMEPEVTPISPSYHYYAPNYMHPYTFLGRTSCTTGRQVPQATYYQSPATSTLNYRPQPVCQYFPVQGHMMIPRPPPPSYQSSLPSSYNTINNSSTGGNALRVLPPASLVRPVPQQVVVTNNGGGKDLSSQQPCQSSQRKLGITEELKSLTCGSGRGVMSKLSSTVCSGVKQCLPVEVLIEKVVGNLLNKEPPDYWYTPHIKTTNSDDVFTESITVSAICPITKQKMIYPCRGLYCTHLQCFDAKVFLQLALKKHRPYKVTNSEKHPVCWRCPVCNKTLCPKQLFIDKYLKKTLEASDAIELQCQGKGHWLPLEKQSISIPSASVIDLTLESDDET